MMLAMPLLDTPIIFKENEINILVIENQILYRDTIEQFITQSNGQNGNLVLSEDNIPISSLRSVEIIMDIFNLEFNEKRILSRMQKDACDFSENYLEVLNEITEKINAFAFDLSLNFTMPVKFRDAGDISAFIKYLDFTVDIDELSYSEKLIEYIKLLRDYAGKTFFVFVGLRTMFSAEELELIYKSIVYEKINVLLLENHYEREYSEYEKTTIIDNDLCIIR